MFLFVSGEDPVLLAFLFTSADDAIILSLKSGAQLEVQSRVHRSLRLTYVALLLLEFLIIL